VHALPHFLHAHRLLQLDQADEVADGKAEKLGQSLAKGGGLLHDFGQSLHDAEVQFVLARPSDTRPPLMPKHRTRGDISAAPRSAAAFR